MIVTKVNRVALIDKKSEREFLMFYVFTSVPDWTGENIGYAFMGVCGKN